MEEELKKSKLQKKCTTLQEILHLTLAKIETLGRIAQIAANIDMEWSKFDNYHLNKPNNKTLMN
jgi:hypothetical protein